MYPGKNLFPSRVVPASHYTFAFQASFFDVASHLCSILDHDQKAAGRYDNSPVLNKLKKESKMPFV
jgi:hypothetical protein